MRFGCAMEAAESVGERQSFAGDAWLETTDGGLRPTTAAEWRRLGFFFFSFSKKGMVVCMRPNGLFKEKNNNNMLIIILLFSFPNLIN